VAPIAERLMPRLKAHSLKAGMVAFFEPLIPSRLLSCLSLPTTRMVPAFVVRHTKTATLGLGAIDRERAKLLTATTGTGHGYTGSLSFRGCHGADHNTGNLEKQGEFRRSPTRTILSEAAEGLGSAERATTRRVSPNDNPAHERPARKGRDSLASQATVRSLG
jgi:hypothetical protein